MLMPKRTKYRRPHRVSYEGKAKIGKVNVDEEGELASSFAVVQEILFINTNERLKRKLDSFGIK